MQKLTDDEAADFAIATFVPEARLSESQKAALSTIDVILSAETPFVEDIQSLYKAYDALYFRGLLEGTAELIWSKKLTLCAGICELKRKEDRNSPKEVKVKLSEALLKYRPREDTVNTLIHESIHAYFFVAGGKHVRGDDPSGHGIGFLRLAHAINKHGAKYKYNITVYHTFHDEVDSYRTHIWHCSGPCINNPPFFGIVKRAMNRPPGPSDTWYAVHEQSCGGAWTKIAEPPPNPNKRKMNGKGKEKENSRLDKWVIRETTSDASFSTRESKVGRILIETGDEYEGGQGSEEGEVAMKRRKKEEGEDDEIEIFTPEKKNKKKVSCPICDKSIEEERINEHLDGEHGFS